MNIDDITSSSSGDSPKDDLGSPLSLGSESDIWHGHGVTLEEVTESLKISLERIKLDKPEGWAISNLKENLQHLEICLEDTISDQTLKANKDKIVKISDQLKEIGEVSQKKKIDIKKELEKSEKMISDSLKKIHAAKVIQRALRGNIILKHLKEPDVKNLPEAKFRRWIKLVSPRLEGKIKHDNPMGEKIKNKLENLFYDKFDGKPIQIPVFTALPNPRGKFPNFPKYEMKNLQELHLSDYIFDQGIFYSPDVYEALKRGAPKCEITTMEEANALVQALAKLDFMSWERTEDGCMARAEVTCQFLKMMGISLDKIGKFFIYPDHPYMVKYGEEIIKWHYHVAPAILVGKEWVVLDPSMDSSKAFLRLGWVKKLQETSAKAAAETIVEKEVTKEEMIPVSKKQTLLVRTKFGLQSGRATSQHESVYVFETKAHEVLTNLKWQFQVMQHLQNDKTLSKAPTLLAILNGVEDFHPADPLEVYKRIVEWTKKPHAGMILDTDDFYHLDPSILFHAGISWKDQLAVLTRAYTRMQTLPSHVRPVFKKNLEKKIEFIKEQID